MHEHHLAEKIVSLAVTRARELRRDKIRTVKVRISALTCVRPDSLQAAFQTAARHAGLDGAELIVETVEPTCRCEDCGADFVPDIPATRCVQCGSPRVVLQEGPEMEIERIE